MAGEELLMATGLGALWAFFMGMIVLFLIVAVALYIYMALALSTIAKKTGTPNEWLAWIPVGNLVLMANIAKMHWWPVLLLIGLVIPFVNFLFAIALMVFVIVWLWKICEARSRPGWWSILIIIPFAGGIWALVMYGILAWAEK